MEQLYKTCKKNYTRYKKSPEKMYVLHHSGVPPPPWLRLDLVAKYLCKYGKVIYYPEIDSKHICSYAGFYGTPEVMTVYTYHENDFYNGLAQSKNINWVCAERPPNITFTKFLIYHDRKDVFTACKIPSDHYIVLGIFWQDWWYYEYFLRQVSAINIAAELVRVSKTHNKNCLTYLDRLPLTPIEKHWVAELISPDYAGPYLF